ncbi:MAG: serine hydrolase [Gemmatimonadaceae bacterium]
MRTPLALLAAAALLPTPAVSQVPHREILRSKLEREFRQISESFTGVMGIQFVDLTDGTRIGVNEQLVFPQGSSIKIPILIELFRQAEGRPGILRERQRVTAATRTGGSGVIGQFADGSSELSNEDLAVLMIVLSDNTATNLLIDAVGTDAVNRTMASLGAPQTKLQRKMIRPEASARGEENVSTAREAADLMVRVARCDLPVSRDSCARIRRILEIPKSDAVRRAVPGDVAVASKPGGIEGVAAIWAIVAVPDRPFVLAAMTNYGGDGDEAISRAARAAFDYATRLARSTPHGARVPLGVIESERRRAKP